MFHFRPSVNLPARLTWEPTPAVTDWDWFMEFVRKGGEGSLRRYENWIRRRSSLTEGFRERFDEFKGFRHEKLYGLRPSDFDRAKQKMGKDHALGDLKKNLIDHSLSKDFTPPVPFMYPFHVLLEEIGRFPAWWEVWEFLVKDRPDLVMTPYAAYNGLKPTDAEFKTKRYAEAFRWRVGIVYYSWLREVHLLTELRCVHRLDVRYHFAADAEWKADLIGGDVLLELYVTNEAYKTAQGKGRKETCATANPWAKTVRFGFANQFRRERPYLIENDDISKIAAEMAAAGCPSLP